MLAKVSVVFSKVSLKAIFNAEQGPCCKNCEARPCGFFFLRQRLRFCAFARVLIGRSMCRQICHKRPWRTPIITGEIENSQTFKMNPYCCIYDPCTACVTFVFSGVWFSTFSHVLNVHLIFRIKCSRLPFQVSSARFGVHPLRCILCWVRSELCVWTAVWFGRRKECSLIA